MSTSAQPFTSASHPPQPFNPTFADHLISAEPSADVDTAAQLSHYLTIYIDLLDAVNNQDFPTMKRQLSHFKRLLTSQVADSYRHLLQLQKRHGQGAADKDRASGFHHDMVAIGGKLLPLLNRYDSRSVDSQSMAGLLNDLTDVGEVLMAV